MNKEFHGGRMMRVITKRASILGLSLALLLSLAGPPNVSAITLQVNSTTTCALNIGTTCNLDPVLFSVIRVDNGNQGLLNAPFADVAVSVESFTANAFEYRYQIINPRFAIQLFQLDLSAAFGLNANAVTNPLTPPVGETGDFIKGLGFDAVTNPNGDPNIVTPDTAGMAGDQFLATFTLPPITPAGGGIQKSDIMFIQSPLSPIELVSFLAGTQLDASALTALALLQGPGSLITAGSEQNPAPAPEPSTLLLLGSGLLGLGAAWRRRASHSTAAALNS